MDFSNLVDEITRRVLARIQSSGEGPEASKRKLLVLTAARNARFDHFLSTTRLNDCFELTCLPDPCPEENLDLYEALVLFDLRIEELGRISSGVCGSPYSCLVTRAILTGKRIYLPAREIELLCYEQSAPPRYFAMMKEKLDLLERSGVKICSLEDLEAELLGLASGYAVKACPAPVGKTCECQAGSGQRSPAPGFRVDKRVLTEKDLIEARMKGATEVLIRQSCIITDLACEYARARQMKLVRDA